MDKAVVRRGVGAIVLALVAALLLGYLLKGKAPDRKEVVDKQTMPTGIQMFPDSEKESVSSTASNVSNGSGAGNTVAVGAIAAAGAAAASALASDSGKQPEVRRSFNSSQDRLVDANSGNASMGKSRLVIDGAGQGVVDTKNMGARETPAQFSIQAPKKDEVRPVVDRAVSKRIVKSNARLVGERRLPPVGSRKIASSKDTSANARKVATTKASSVAKKSSGRNKYSIQLFATSNLSKAKNLSSTMKKEGYDTYVETSKKGSGNLYRVRLGSFSGKADAMKTQATLKRRYRANAYVRDSLVVRN